MPELCLFLIHKTIFVLLRCQTFHPRKPIGLTIKRHLKKKTWLFVLSRKWCRWPAVMSMWLSHRHHWTCLVTSSIYYCWLESMTAASWIWLTKSVKANSGCGFRVPPLTTRGRVRLGKCLAKNYSFNSCCDLAGKWWAVRKICYLRIRNT